MESLDLSVLSYALLALATLASALVVLFARRAVYASTALGLNTLLLAAISLTLSAGLVAAALAMIGMSTVLVSLILGDADRPCQVPDVGNERPRRSRGVVATGIGLVFWIGVGGVLLVGNPPGHRGATEVVASAGADDTVALAAALFGPCRLGVVIISLIVLTVLVGSRLSRGEH